MFSYSYMFSVHGDPIFADKVEQITFSALPASITPDMWAHQSEAQARSVMNAMEMAVCAQQRDGAQVRRGVVAALR